MEASPSRWLSLERAIPGKTMIQSEGILPQGWQQPCLCLLPEAAGRTHMLLMLELVWSHSVVRLCQAC